jgi:hypothetical protein
MCIYCYIISKADRERIRPVFECVLQEVHHQEPLQLYGVTASDTKNFNQLCKSDLQSSDMVLPIVAFHSC